MVYRWDTSNNCFIKGSLYALLLSIVNSFSKFLMNLYIVGANVGINYNNQLHSS